MWLRLAALFGCPVSEAQARVSSREFTEWCAFYRLEPWGAASEDERAALVAHTVASCSGRLKRRMKIADFMIRRGPPRRQTRAEVLAILENAARAR